MSIRLPEEGGLLPNKDRVLASTLQSADGRLRTVGVMRLLSGAVGGFRDVCAPARDQASVCFDGCARSNASRAMQASKTDISFG